MPKPDHDHRKIFAIGGGGFSEPMGQYTLDLVDVASPKVCFLPTASGDAPLYIENFYASFEALGAECSHVNLNLYNQADPASHLLNQDVIYVGGGNVFHMLLIWRAHGLDKVLRQAWEQGIVMTGLSAGSICWFRGGNTDSWGKPLRPFNDGLGLLPGSHSPHYDSEPERKISYERLIADGDLPPGIAIEDSCGVLFRGQQLIESVCSVIGKKAYRVSFANGVVTQETISTRFIGVRQQVI